jgi:hypothetical protein
MLDCRKNRLDYGQLLTPPSGYRLDRAIATAYSVDLGTLLSIPIALVHSQTLEGDPGGARLQLLEAIKRFSRQVKVYHQKGQLLLPAKLNWLYAWLEDALVPVLQNEPFSAFHPKMWLIRYVQQEDGAEEPTRYRFISLSRNLTFDRSWDVAASLDGTPRNRQFRRNRPLLDFLRALDRESPVDGLDQLLEELGRVEFETPFPFESHAFHPMGIEGHGGGALLSGTSRGLLVVSPFLHQKAIKSLVERTTRRLSVFSEYRELEKLPQELLERFDGHYLSEVIVDGEKMAGAEDGGPDAMQQNLHAKLFIFEDPENISWFLGSANATEAAVTKNIEFMLELRGTRPACGIRPRLKEFTGEDSGKGPFIPFDATEGGRDNSAEVARDGMVRRFEHALLKSDIIARIETASNGINFDLHLDFDLRAVEARDGFKLFVQPFNWGGEPSRLVPGTWQERVFGNIAEVELSRFIHFRIEDGPGLTIHSFLLKIDMPLPATRLDNILRRIIDSQDKFFDYLRFLLADEIRKEDLLGGDAGKKRNAPAEQVGGIFNHMPIYEQLLVTASRQPHRLQEIDGIVRQLSEGGDESVVPAAFLSFWEMFKPFIPLPPSGKP